MSMALGKAVSTQTPGGPYLTGLRMSQFSQLLPIGWTASPVFSVSN